MQDELARTCQRTYASDQRKLDELTDQLNPENGQTLRGGRVIGSDLAKNVIEIFGRSLRPLKGTSKNSFLGMQC